MGYGAFARSQVSPFPDLHETGWICLNRAIFTITVVVCACDIFLHAPHHRLLWHGGIGLEYEYRHCKTQTANHARYVYILSPLMYPIRTKHQAPKQREQKLYVFCKVACLLLTTRRCCRVQHHPSSPPHPECRHPSTCSRSSL